MRSQLNNHNLACYLRSTTWKTRRILQIMLSIVTILLLITCDQTPTTLDEEPYSNNTQATTFSVELTTLEFDFQSQTFFFSAAIASPNEIQSVQAGMIVNEIDQIASFALNDAGLEGDILINDGSYDANFRLPDSLAFDDNKNWQVSVTVVSDAETKSASQSIELERPAAPIISNVSHLDTLTLLPDALVLDTLSMTVTHPKGLDEIRDVSMMSLKPDGTYANNGQPIPLYDDGGSVVFFTFGGIDFSSGDKIAGDGIYSLLLALSPGNLSGTYYWTFNSRTWLGIEAESVADSLVVLPAPNPSPTIQTTILRTGVFQ